MEQDSKFPRDSHRRPLLCVLASSAREFEAIAPQICFRSEGSQDVLGATHKELADPNSTRETFGYLGLERPEVMKGRDLVANRETRK